MVDKLNVTQKIEDNKREKQITISFPHMGNYYVPVYSLLSRIVPNANILVPPKITRKTLELGEKNSPDFVCTPFKYNLGNYIEGLEKGADVLMQAGGGCRFGYYAELQEQILRDLGYDFKFITLFDAKGVDLISIYKKFKLINSKLKLNSFIYHFMLTIRMVKVLDEFETFVRRNMCFEVNKGTLDKIHNDFLKELKFTKTFKQLNNIKLKYNSLINNVKMDKSKDVLRVGIVGELYDIMEPFSNFFLERELAKMNIEVKRNITVTYLLFEKGKAEKGLLESANKYIKYALGADGTESVAHSKQMCEQGFDGIIHIKPFGCTPEINAIPILQKISNDYNVPIIYFTFDMQTSETGVKTRLEAFYDMLIMKKEAAKNA